MSVGRKALMSVPIACALAAAATFTPAAGTDMGTDAVSGARSGEASDTRVGVSVATLWVAPDSPRPVDDRAVRTPADPAGWVSGLTTAGRRGLNGRVESQALLGQTVTVLAERGIWSRVVLPGQPSPKSAQGYPGWIPTAQLVQSPPPYARGGPSDPTAPEAVVVRRSAWAHANATLNSRVLRLSYGTRLPVAGTTGRAVEVTAPDGRSLWVAAKRVELVAAGAPARRPTGPAVVAEARKFLGLPYLWGGTSGFGFDCSGLTHAVYAQLGVTIPRDATPQFATGTPVARVRDLRKGDLVFFRTRSGAIHHVGIYAGKGRMIHSPRTGQPVQVSSITKGLWAREFAGGRRYL
jgi:cell wall-associated NlpC family hydrolase